MSMGIMTFLVRARIVLVIGGFVSLSPLSLSLSLCIFFILLIRVQSLLQHNIDEMAIHIYRISIRIGANEESFVLDNLEHRSKSNHQEQKVLISTDSMMFCRTQQPISNEWMDR